MESKYDNYIGGLFTYKGEQVTITDIVESSKTNIHVFCGKGKRFLIPKYDLDKEFKPIKSAVKQINGDIPAGSLMTYPGFERDREVLNDVSKIIMDNIAKINESETNIPKAKAVNDQIKTLINLQVVKVRTFTAMKTK
jgi:hypothetical protein